MNFLISPAMAAEGVAGAEGAWGSVLLLVGFVLIFYFLLWRPQSKRAKEHRELISSLDKGDEIVTSGGVVGKVLQLNDDFLEVSIAENIAIKVSRGTVVKILPKGSIKSIFNEE